jgi:ABC-type multidrug transport system permease subunit
LYSWLSYRALFTWLSPAAYISSLVLVPFCSGLLLILVGEQTGADLSRPAVGSAMLSTANAVIFGISFATMNERRFGTLHLNLSAPQRLVETLVAKSAIHVLNGLVTGLVTFLLIAEVAHIRLVVASGLELLLCAFTGALACGGLATMCAAMGLWSRDALGLPNIIRSLLLVASGALVPPAAILVDIGWISPFLPLHNAVAAGLDAVHGHALPLRSLGLELAVGLLWAAAGALLFKLTLVFARRTGSLEFD